MQKVGSLNSDFCQSFRKEVEWMERQKCARMSFHSSVWSPSGVSRILCASVSPARSALSRYGGRFFLREVILKANSPDDQGILSGHSVTKRFSFSG